MGAGGQAKVSIVGDGAIRKTCLLTRIQGEEELDWEDPEYQPTTFNNFVMTWECEGQSGELEIWDTAGQEAFEQLRKLSTPGTDVYLVGYSVVSSTSLSNIQHKWLPEIEEV